MALHLGRGARVQRDDHWQLEPAQPVQQPCEHCRVVGVLRPVDRRQHELVRPQAVLLHDRRARVGRRQHPQHGFDHRVPGDQDLLVGDALGLQVAGRMHGRGETQVGRVIDEDPVQLLGHPAIEAAQPCFDMQARDIAGSRGQRTGQRGVRIALHHHEVRPVLQEQRVELGCPRADLGTARGAADTQRDVDGHPQVAQDGAAHRGAEVLAGMHHPRGVAEQLDDALALDGFRTSTMTTATDRVRNRVVGEATPSAPASAGAATADITTHSFAWACTWEPPAVDQKQRTEPSPGVGRATCRVVSLRVRLAAAVAATRAQHGAAFKKQATDEPVGAAVLDGEGANARALLVLASKLRRELASFCRCRCDLTSRHPDPHPLLVVRPFGTTHPKVRRSRCAVVLAAPCTALCGAAVTGAQVGRRHGCQTL